MVISERIKLIRGSKSQDIFAQEVGVSKMTVGRWERGERVPDADNLTKILKEYPNIKPAWLLLGEGDMRSGDEALEALGAMFDGERDKEKSKGKDLLLTVLEAVEEAQKKNIYDMALMTPRERTAMIYTLYVLFSEEQLKPLANKEFIAGQSGFVYLLLRDHESFTKKAANLKHNMDVLNISDELNLFGMTINILGGLLNDGDGELPAVEKEEHTT